MSTSPWIVSAVAAAALTPLAACSQSGSSSTQTREAFVTPAVSEGGPVAKPGKSERCYGIVEAGKNDCETATGSCAGTVHTDSRADAWIYVPSGLCSKIAGASTTPPSAS